MERGPAAKAVTVLRRGNLRESPTAVGALRPPLAPIRSTQRPAGEVIPAS
jgi:hypothetical protein